MKYFDNEQVLHSLLGPVNVEKDLVRYCGDTRWQQSSSHEPTISSCCVFLLATRPCKTKTSRRNASLSARSDSFCLASCATVFWSSSITTVSRNRLLRADLRFAARRRSFLSSSEAHGPLLRVMLIVSVLKQRVGEQIRDSGGFRGTAQRRAFTKVAFRKK